MLIFLSCLWFIFLICICVHWYGQDGALFPFDLNRIGVIVWALGTGLYDLGLSNILHPDVEMNVVSAIVAVVFLIFESVSSCDTSLLSDCARKIRVPNNVFYWFFFSLMMVMCLWAFRANIETGNMRLFSNNPGKDINFTGGYLLRLSVPIAMTGYYALRLTRSKVAKVMALAIFLPFAFVTAASLDRGPIVWLLTGILIFEIFRYADKRGKIYLNPKTLALVIVLAVIVLYAFDSFGSTRTSAQGISNIARHYEMNVNIPDGFTWIYIYITTPLENARFAIENLSVGSPTVGAKLFYPLVKAIANVFGQGDTFANWLSANETVYAYLKVSHGLTVGSFLLDAIQDFSYFGILIYPLAYGFVALFFKWLLSRRIISPFTKVIVYALIFQDPLWSIFDNTVISGVLFVCAAFFIGTDLLTSLLTKRRGLSKQTVESGVCLD